jgi:hypothetical protein
MLHYHLFDEGGDAHPENILRCIRIEEFSVITVLVDFYQILPSGLCICVKAFYTIMHDLSSR